MPGPQNQRSLDILGEYLRGERPNRRAAMALAERGILGRFFAAEVLIDDVADVEPNMVSTRLMSAQGHLKSVMAQTRQDVPDSYDNVGTRAWAGMRMAQLETLGIVYSKGILPGPGAVGAMYDRLRRHAISTTKSIRDRYQDRSNTVAETKSAMGILATLLLAQRHALRAELCGKWLPLQTMLSANRAFLRGENDRHFHALAHDEDSGALTEARQYKIKTYREVGEVADPSTLYVYPDLRSYDNEQLVSTHIIADCEHEARLKRPPKGLTEQLNARTRQLFHVIGQPSPSFYDQGVVDPAYFSDPNPT